MRTGSERNFETQLWAAIQGSKSNAVDQFRNFPLYTPRQDLTRFLVRHELFKQVLEVHGSIVECGVYQGGGLLAWSHLSAIMEPYNHTRRVIGFDTFKGFPSVSQADGVGHEVGDLASNSYDEVLQLAGLHDSNRPNGHIPKVELVRGNAVDTIPEYVKSNPHLLVSLLYLDFDLYEPTARALTSFLPRMPRGSILAFDEAGMKEWPGETKALLEFIGPSGSQRLELKRHSWQSTISYAVL